MAALTKSVRAALPSSEVEVEVSIEEFTKEELLAELVRLDVITDDDEGLLMKGESLFETYTRSARKDFEEAGDSFKEDTTHVRSLIMRRDAPEALIQIERMHPDFDGIVALFEREA